MISIALIPAFNEEKTIGKAVSILKAVGLKAIVVNDGSVDRTGEIARKEGAIVITHERNLGKGAALKTGFNYILKKYPDVMNVVVIDADLQYSPKEALKLLKPLEEKKADFVMGFRNWKKVPFANRLGNFIWRTLFNWFFSTNLKDTNCGYIALTRKTIKKLKGIYGGYIIENCMLRDVLKSGLRIKQVPVNVTYRRRAIPNSARMFFGVLIFILKEGMKYKLSKI